MEYKINPTRALDNADWTDGAAKRREALRTLPQTPIYHYVAPDGILNDPNGLVWWRGNYHLFYQYKPDGSLFHWGHAYSPDLLHWTDLPPALYPQGESQVYSGQAMVDDDRVIAIYHATHQGNCIATAGNDLLTDMGPIPGNPVIPKFQQDGTPQPYFVFDPCIWKEEDGYYALSGGRSPGNVGYSKDPCRNQFPLFRSQDLEHWEYLGLMFEDGFYTGPGEDGGVPNFLPLGPDRYLLLFFSHKRASQYYIGAYDKQSHKFMPITHGRMTYNHMLRGALHAASATIDPKGRVIAFFNVKNDKHNQDKDNVVTLPRVLSLGEDDTLLINPAEEVALLRGEKAVVGAMDIPANEEIVLPGIRGNAMEICARIDPCDAREFGLYVLRSDDGRERTRISLFPEKIWAYGCSKLQIDNCESSLADGLVGREPEFGPVPLKPGEPLELRVFIDRCIVEVYANGMQCLTLRVSPTLPDAVGVSLFARGAAARLLDLQAYQMNDIWADRPGEGCQ